MSSAISSNMSDPPMSPIPFETHGGEAETRVYKKRYFILAIFIILSASNAMQWIEYSIIAHIITEFYDVSFESVNWTSMIYMLMYTILIFPGR